MHVGRVWMSQAEARRTNRQLHTRCNLQEVSQQCALFMNFPPDACLRGGPFGKLQQVQSNPWQSEPVAAWPHPRTSTCVQRQCAASSSASADGVIGSTTVPTMLSPQLLLRLLSCRCRSTAQFRRGPDLSPVWHLYTCGCCCSCVPQQRCVAGRHAHAEFLVVADMPAC